MTYLVASAVRAWPAELNGGQPRLQRDFRRFNVPVQLALAAAADIVGAAEDPGTMAVVSLAPCQNGSPELSRWAETAIAAGSDGRFGATRMNPTHTLHVIDNLALSAFVIAHQSDGYCLGVGGAPGQAWCALESVCERLAGEWEREALLMAGDQARAKDASGSMGVALLFSTRPRPYAPLGLPVDLVGIDRQRRPMPEPLSSHAAEGLCGFLGALARPGQRAGRFVYLVPDEHTDGIDQVTLAVEIG
jgi:hypothetical protein